MCCSLGSRPPGRQRLVSATLREQMFSVNASAILDDVELSPFRIERFYARYEHSTRFMLSSSDCESRTIGALLELEPDAHGRLLETWCGYTESPGGPELRQAIASLYERTGAEEVVATSCAEEGIFLLYHALLRPGDHVIVERPATSRRCRSRVVPVPR